MDTVDATNHKTSDCRSKHLNQSKSYAAMANANQRAKQRWWRCQCAGAKG
jgi:hypothetical protein